MAALQFVTHENVFKLIEMVQSEECLWDMRCACYHDRNRKRRVIEEIGEKLQLTGKYVLLIPELVVEVPVQSSAIIAGCQSVSYTDTVPCNILTLPPLELLQSLCLCSRKMVDSGTFSELDWIRRR